MIAGLLILLSAPFLLAFAYASYGPRERRLLAVRVLLVAMTVAAFLAVSMSLIDLIATPTGGIRRLVRLIGSLSIFFLVVPFLISMLVSWRRKEGGP